jgi:hypothetical protein
MIGPAQVIDKARRAYPALLRSWLRGEPFTPLRIVIGAPPTEYRALQQAVAQLHAQSKAQQGYGYELEIEQRNTRAYGLQSLPIYAHIRTQEDLLALVDKRAEFAQFQSSVALIRAELPQLEDWVAQHIPLVVTHHAIWPELVQVCTYFLAHPRPGRYPRELPIPVHTKFIEQQQGILRQLLDALLPPEYITVEETHFERRYGLRYDEPMLRLRMLDPLVQQRFHLPVSDLSIPLSEAVRLLFAGCQVLVVENKLPFLTLPALPNTVAIFGSGFAVEHLGRMPWLVGSRVLYWGDLDAHGFQILHRLRAHLPQVQSIMMEEATFRRFERFAVLGTAATLQHLPQLTDDEQAMYAYLVRSQQRLEQEHLAYTYVLQVLHGLLG